MYFHCENHDCAQGKPLGFLNKGSQSANLVTVSEIGGGEVGEGGGGGMTRSLNICRNADFSHSSLPVVFSINNKHFSL